MSNTLLSKTYLLSLMLLETLDELELQSEYKHRLKQKGNQFKKELDKFCDDVFDTCDNDTDAANYVVEMSKKIDKLIENS